MALGPRADRVEDLGHEEDTENVSKFSQKMEF